MKYLALALIVYFSSTTIMPNWSTFQWYLVNLHHSCEALFTAIIDPRLIQRISIRTKQSFHVRARPTFHSHPSHIPGFMARRSAAPAPYNRRPRVHTTLPAEIYNLHDFTRRGQAKICSVRGC